MRGGLKQTSKIPGSRIRPIGTKWIALAAALMIVATACSNPDQVRGLVLEVEGDLTSVESFVLRTDDGETLTIIPAAEGDFRFPLPHLNDHRASFSPIIVELDRSVDPPIATAIRDADSAEWHK